MNNQGLHNRPTFSSLSRDVKTLIYDFAYGRDAYHASNSPKRFLGLTRPISKAFLEVQRVALYGDVEFASYRQLVAFAKTVTQINHIAKVVKSIVIELDWQSDGTRASPVSVEQTDPRNPDSVTIETPFQDIVNLESLVVVGSSRIAELAMSPSGADTRFRNLKSLLLASTFSNLNDPFHRIHFLPLEYWTKLESFSYDVQRLSDTITFEEVTPDGRLVPVPSPFPSFPSIKSVELRGTIGRDLFGGPKEKNHTFLKAFPAFPFPHDPHRREHGSFRCRLCRSHLRRPPQPSPPHHSEAHPLRRRPPLRPLPHYSLVPSLERLIIGGEGLQIKAKLYDNLKQLRNLRSVTFELGLKGVATSNLTKLLIGPGRHTGIEDVFLDHVKHDASKGCFPEWTARFKPTGLTKFLSQIEKHSQVTVEGDAVDALEQVEEEMSEGELLGAVGALKERYSHWDSYLEGMQF